MGAVLSPALLGVKQTRHLPNASTFCGRCEAVCPMNIPLPKMLRRWREISHDNGDTPMVERSAIKCWAWVARQPWLYGLSVRVAARLLSWAGGRGGRISRQWPLLKTWTRARDFPAPQGRSFQEQWARQQRDAQKLARSGQARSGPTP